MKFKEYEMPDGRKAVFEYDENGVGKITLECMDMLMGLINDRKTEPTRSKMEQVDEPKTQMKTQNSNLTFEKADEPQLTPNYCGTCKHREVPCGDLPCDVCHGYSNYEPKDEPQTDCAWNHG